ncbi:MAG: pyridoxal phosphate-dependent aminotransferase [Candidatus Eremiobacteraeota bacterium]|nr:pyridoxal phosphate-dependent aminotransferase [Candidatus Eremiobacteraeota bacterium]
MRISAPGAPRLSATATGIAEAMSIKFNMKVYELKRAGKQVCVLSLGEAFFDLPVVDMSDLPYPAVHHYSDSRGIPELRAAIAGYYTSRYGLPVDPDREIILTAGSKAAIYMALLACVDPGDEVLLPEPAWVSYTEQVRLVHGVPVGIPYDVPPGAWHTYVTPRTKVLIINNPHNPTGYRYRDDEIRGLVELARERGMWLFSDEAYSDFAHGGGFVSTGHFDPEKHNVVVFNSISKNYGISGWRLGYSIAGPALTEQILKLNQHLVTCPATILEYYIARHFNDILAITKPQIAALLDTRAQVARFMDGIGLRYLPGDSTFYFFVSIAPSRLSSEDFCMRLLEEHAICTVPGIGYGASCDAFVRVSVGTEPLGDIERALVTLKELVDATS